MTKIQKPQKTLKPLKPGVVEKAGYVALWVSFAKKLNYIIATNTYRQLPAMVQEDQKLNYKHSLTMFDQIKDKIRKEADALILVFIPLILTHLKRIQRNTSNKYNKIILKKLGRDVSILHDASEIEDQFTLVVRQNVGLIKSLTEKQLSRVENMILSELRAGNFNTKALQDMLMHDFGITERHARFIASDQTNKLVEGYVELRNEQLGVQEYIWRTREDLRVRGNPDGLYPKARPSHFAREGKIYKYKQPPEGGNPGKAPGCRCVSEAILPG